MRSNSSDERSLIKTKQRFLAAFDRYKIARDLQAHLADIPESKAAKYLHERVDSIAPKPAGKWSQIFRHSTTILFYVSLFTLAKLGTGIAIGTALIGGGVIGGLVVAKDIRSDRRERLDQRRMRFSDRSHAWRLEQEAREQLARDLASTGRKIDYHALESDTDVQREYILNLVERAGLHVGQNGPVDDDALEVLASRAADDVARDAIANERLAIERGNSWSGRRELGNDNGPTLA